MKNTTYALLCMGLLFFASCKKNDLDKETNPETAIENIATPASQPSKISAWNTISNWDENTSNSSVLYNGTINNAALTTETLNDGLVLVFAKNANSFMSLPVQTSDVYWYYQVSEGKIVITGKGANNSSKNLNFSYVIISKSQLDALEIKGKSKSDLINLSFQQAQELFK